MLFDIVQHPLWLTIADQGIVRSPISHFTFTVIASWSIHTHCCCTVTCCCTVSAFIFVCNSMMYLYMNIFTISLWRIRRSV